MAELRSLRADILTQLLPYISARRYERVYGEFWIFGRTLEEVTDDMQRPPSEQEDFTLLDCATELIGDLTLHDGRVEASGRSNLHSEPRFKTASHRGLTTEERGELKGILESLSQQPKPIHDHLSKESVGKLEDSLDAKFANEVLGKLPKIVERASTLDKLALEGVPEKTKQYFEEAHNCYLYGFNVAFAVLCRSILESALIEKVDEDGVLEMQIGRQNREPTKKLTAHYKTPIGYYKALVLKAERDGYLSPDRPKVALEVRDAGNDAIHDIERFNREWRNRLEETLISTRKVLLELYSAKPTDSSGKV